MSVRSAHQGTPDRVGVGEGSLRVLNNDYRYNAETRAALGTYTLEDRAQTPPLCLTWVNTDRQIAC
jgi:hypothetical protein